MVELGVTLAVRDVLHASRDEAAHLGLLRDVVEAQMTPRCGQRIGTMGQALARAWRWRLRWRLPRERAIAESVPLGPAVIA